MRECGKLGVTARRPKRSWRFFFVRRAYTPSRRRSPIAAATSENKHLGDFRPACFRGAISTMAGICNGNCVIKVNCGEASSLNGLLAHRSATPLHAYAALSARAAAYQGFVDQKAYRHFKASLSGLLSPLSAFLVAYLRRRPDRGKRGNAQWREREQARDHAARRMLAHSLLSSKYGVCRPGKSLPSRRAQIGARLREMPAAARWPMARAASAARPRYINHRANIIM